MYHLIRPYSISLFALFVNMSIPISISFAQQSNQPIVSPEVHEDGKVTFRVRAPKAESVRLQSGEIQTVLADASMQFTHGGEGIWSLSVGPLPPGIYDYTFDIDGVVNTDPASPFVFGNRQGSRGYVEIPGPPDQPRHDEWRETPHGVMTMHWYTSSAADGNRRRLHVYLPPDYYQHPDRQYPTLYLLHGSGDNDSHWMWMGRSNVILDNLIADGKAVPMIVVMPDGHVPVRSEEGEERTAYRIRANQAFERDMMDAIIPLIETNYRVIKNRDHRAIVGLSMGGGQSLRVGLNNLPSFAWIGGFSSSTRGLESTIDQLKQNPQGVNEQLRLLWIAIGKDDFLIEGNRELHRTLTELKIEHDYIETEGVHQWSVWRRYLADFAPLLFH